MKQKWLAVLAGGGRFYVDRTRGFGNYRLMESKPTRDYQHAGGDLRYLKRAFDRIEVPE